LGAAAGGLTAALLGADAYWFATLGAFVATTALDVWWWLAHRRSADEPGPASARIL
jgi:hypothetical protein